MIERAGHNCCLILWDSESHMVSPNPNHLKIFLKEPAEVIQIFGQLRHIYMDYIPFYLTLPVDPRETMETLK